MVNGPGPDAAPEEMRVREVADALRGGEVVALPTDTVYGLGVLPGDRRGGERLFELKGRPDSVPLPVLVSDPEAADELAEPGIGGFDRLAARFWPGALTIVVPRRDGLDWALGGDGLTIGIRCPDHDLLRQLLRETGPLAVSSANRHGDAPATTAEEVRLIFGEGVRYLDGGRCQGQPSTVVALDGDAPRLLREGAIAFSELLAVLSP